MNVGGGMDRRNWSQTIVASWACLLSCSLTLVAQDSWKVDKAILQVDEQRLLPARVSSSVVSSSVQEGTFVSEGQTVMELDNTRVSLGLAKLRQELAVAEKQASSRVELEFMEKSVAVARAELQRAQESNRKLPGLVSESELDRLELMVDRAEAERNKTSFTMEINEMLLQVKRAEIAELENELNSHRVVAPMAGMVIEVFKRPGEWATLSESMARVVRLDLLKSEIKLPLTVARAELIDQPVMFTPDPRLGHDHVYRGVVRFVHPETNPVDALARVWVEIVNDDLVLRPGMSGVLAPGSSPDSRPSQ